MNIVLTSDFHGMLPDIPDCDLLLIAGDICPNYMGNLHTQVAKQAAWLDRGFRRWLDNIVARDIEVVAIWGNHDFIGQEYGGEAVPDLPWTLLHDCATHVRGLTIWGTPWVTNLPQWAFNSDEEALRHRYSIIPKVDILLAHAPPYGVRDRTLDGEHVGCHTLLKRVERLKPKMVVCGHIHEDYGIGGVGGVPVYNVSHCTVRYEPLNRPVEAQLEVE